MNKLHKQPPNTQNSQLQTPQQPNPATDTKTISGKEYIVKSVFLGNHSNGTDIKSTILRLAERKTFREMGLDIPVEKT